MSDRTYTNTGYTVQKSEPIGQARLEALREGEIITVTEKDGTPIRLLYADEYDIPRAAPLGAFDAETGKIHSTETPEPLDPDRARDTAEGIRAGKELIAGDGEPVVIEPCAGGCGKKVAVPASQYNRAGRYACAECAPVVQRRDEDRRHGAAALGRAITERLRQGQRPRR